MCQAWSGEGRLRINVKTKTGTEGTNKVGSALERGLSTHAPGRSTYLLLVVPVWVSGLIPLYILTYKVVYLLGLHNILVGI